LFVVAVALALDLGVFHRQAHEVKMKEAVGWSAVWVTLGLAFSVVVYFAYQGRWLGLGLDTPVYSTPEAVKQGADLIVRGAVSGREAAEQYLAGYVVEKSLAMDNIFVIAMIFGYFAVPAKYQHRVLFWGIIGALLMRGGMILLGGEAVVRYQWVLILFGLFLVLTALKMALIKGSGDVGSNPVVRLARRLFPTVDFYDGERFLTRRTVKPAYSTDPATGREVMEPPLPPPAGGLSAKRAATPLLLALILVEFTDLVFAVDSIPAVFAVTPDPFIVFTSNIFAVLGLRSLYFCLAALIARFRFLKPALILILAFVGVKLLLLSVPPYIDDVARWFGAAVEEGTPIKIGTGVSLLAVAGTLGTAVALSWLLPGKGVKA
ncbi:MAG: TerC family protein, partial [Phycisphaerales bacterium]|nr:TerC family protein [Phycisphaerales bacterium]